MSESRGPAECPTWEARAAYRQSLRPLESAKTIPLTGTLSAVLLAFFLTRRRNDNPGRLLGRGEGDS